MNIRHSFGHVNDLANIKAKDAAIAETLAWVRHWIIDVEEFSLPPTIESLRMIETKLKALSNA